MLGKLFPLVTRFFAEPSPLFRLRLFPESFRGWFFFFRSRLFVLWLFLFGLLEFRSCFLWLWLRLFSFRLLFFRGFFLDDLGCIDPFNECHGSGVALALAELYNACVTAVAVDRSWRDVVEKFFHGNFLPQRRQGSPARMNRSLLTERHHLFRERSNRLCFGQRGLNALMLDQGANLVRQEGFAVLSRAAKLDRFFLVSHTRP